jgi:hypothetical protein
VALAHRVGGDFVDFHGVPVELAYAPFRADAFAALFSGFSRQVNGNGALYVGLAHSAMPVAAALGAEWKPTFCHGLMQGYSRDGAHVLSDGNSRLDVSPRLGRLSGVIFERDALEISSGMQHIALSLLLRERGVFDAHAATACTKNRALVVLGDSGAGKTTLLLALMAAGCSFLGDDRLLFRAARGRVELLAYPREFHVAQKTAQSFPELSNLCEVTPRIDGKYPLKPLTLWPERFKKSWAGPISLLLPQVEARARTEVRAVNAAEAFGKLLSSSAEVMVDGIERRQEQLEALHTIANTANAFEVALGEDLLATPREAASGVILATAGRGQP